MTPEVTSNKIAELKALRSQLSCWRAVIPLIILIIVFVCMFKIYSAGQNLAVPGPGRDEYIASVQQGLQQDVKPIIELIAKQTYLETKTAVADEFQKINARTPEFAAALHAEVEKLATSIPEKTEKIVATSFADALAKQELALREKFPEVDEKKVADVVLKLAEAVEEQCSYVGEKMFDPHLVSINNIIEDLHHIRRTENVEGPDSIASWDMALIILDLLRHEFDDVRPAEDKAAEETPGEKPAEKKADEKPAEKADEKPAEKPAEKAPAKKAAPAKSKSAETKKQ